MEHSMAWLLRLKRAANSLISGGGSAVYPLAMAKPTRLHVLHLRCCVFFEHKWNKLLATLSETPSPALYVYMADGWSRRIWTTSKKTNNQKACTTCASVIREYLLERGILKVWQGNSIASAIAITSPLGLTAGRTSWNLFTALSQFSYPLRKYSTAPVLQLYLFDGLHASKLTRLAVARHKLWYPIEDAHVPGPSSPPPPLNPAGHSDEVARLTDFALGIRCVSHAFNLSVRWGLRPWSNGPLLENIHIGLKSVRTCSHDLVEHASEFLLSRLSGYSRPVDERLLENRRRYWLLLSPTPEIADEVDIMGIWYDPQTYLLWVYEDVLSQPGFHDRMMTVYSKVFQFRDFSETRWSGIGDCCRRWFMAMSLGLDHIFSMCEKDPDQSMFRLQGYDKCNDVSVRLYGAIGAIAPLVCEGVNLLLLEDDRFLLRTAECRALMNEETEYIIGLPANVWTYLASLCGDSVSAASLRSDVVFVALRTHAYAYKESFEPTMKYPLSLTQGCIRTRLEELMNATLQEVIDPFANQLRMALETTAMGIDAAVKLLMLLRDAPMSTNMVEQSHGVTAAHIAVHSRTGERSMRVRSQLRQSMAAFETDALTKQIDKIDAGMDRLENCIRKRYSGREWVAGQLSHATHMHT